MSVRLSFPEATQSSEGTLRNATTSRTTAELYAELPVFSRFQDLIGNDRFRPLPDDWIVGLADIEASTQAIERGGYKMVNSAGAAVVSAVSNALGHLDFPFIFGGDGASFVVGPQDGDAARDALAATVAWVGEELTLNLRGGALSVGEIRAARHDIRVGRFAVSPNVTYAMFSGGGLAWAESRLKTGDLPLQPVAPGTKPDLTGLSCRFQDHRARNGMILSMLVRPAGTPDDPAFRELAATLLATIEGSPGMSRPEPMFRPLGALSLRSNWLQARLHRRSGEPRMSSYLRSFAQSLAGMVILGSRLSLGAFSARRYLREVVENSDFRKFDDGLMMTLDCSPALADAIETRLGAAERDGIVQFGLHRQAAATVTCVVPSAIRPNHIHFIDGADGGYALAARALKTRSTATREGSEPGDTTLAIGRTL